MALLYRNIFEGKKYVEEYRVQDVESELGMTRDKLIQLALLLGSDYTEGVAGIGIVNAVEIVNAFPNEELLVNFRLVASLMNCLAKAGLQDVWGLEVKSRLLLHARPGLVCRTECHYLCVVLECAMDDQHSMHSVACTSNAMHSLQLEVTLAQPVWCVSGLIL